MRLINFLLAVTFLVLASLQVSGTHPVRWILIYGAMAVVCIFSMFAYYPRKFLFTLAAFFLLYGIYLFRIAEILASAAYPVAADFYSLAGCISVLIFQLIRSYRKK